MKILALVILQVLFFGCKTSSSGVDSGTALKADESEEIDPVLDPGVPENDEDGRNLVSCQGPGQNVADGVNIYLYFMQVDGRFKIVVAENKGFNNKNMFTLFERAICSKPDPRDQIKKMNCVSTETGDSLTIQVANSVHEVVYTATIGHVNPKMMELNLPKVEKDNKVVFRQSTNNKCFFDQRLDRLPFFPGAN